ncbi:MAG: cell division protein FtsX [Acidimicrobiales bacterium]
MAFRPDYVIRETATNFTRNVTLTVATIVTMAIASTLAGGAYFLRQGVRNATLRWQGDVQLIVYMQPDAQEAQVESVEGDLDDNPQVEDYYYLDHQQAYDEFQQLFRDQPDFTDAIRPEELPTSFKVNPETASAAVVRALTREFQQKPGVYEVAAATEDIKKMQETFSRLSVGILVLAAFLGGASILIITNAIRMAMLARRREIEVMKLVGATNWFIRVPYMAEGMVQGLLGWLCSIGLLGALLYGWSRLITSDGTLDFFSTFRVYEIWPTFFWLGVVGCVVGVVVSAVAATRFLKV